MTSDEAGIGRCGSAEPSSSQETSQQEAAMKVFATGGSGYNTSGLVGEDAPQSPQSPVAWRLDNEKRVF
jgi:hypothetical protein